MSAPVSVPGQAAIEVDSISKSFRTAGDERVDAVRGMSFTIRSGEVVALLGPNGAGKSTTIDMILGLTHPDSGTVRVFDGAPLDASRSGRAAAVAQSGGLLAENTVQQTMRVIAALHPGSSIGSCMSRAGITDLADRQVSKCSGGEQQRLRFALALLPDPDLLILDEPTAGMDVRARRDFWREIRVEAQAGRTILFATHYLDEVDEFADRRRHGRCHPHRRRRLHRLGGAGPRDRRPHRPGRHAAARGALRTHLPAPSRLGRADPPPAGAGRARDQGRPAQPRRRLPRPDLDHDGELT